MLNLVILEGAIIALLNAAQRGINACQSLLRAQLGFRVNEMILEKALTLDDVRVDPGRQAPLIGADPTKAYFVN